MIKERVHGRLYPDDASQNTLTKRLVQIAAEGKRAPVTNFATICKDGSTDGGGSQVVEGTNFRPELPEINSERAVQNYYSCVAYSLLSSVIVCTQENTQEKNEIAYANFLFQAQQREAQQSMWSLLIDTSKEYEFKVQTNFNHIELKNIEQRLSVQEAQGLSKRDIAGLRVQNMMNEYLTSSFMSANEKFNQNMVFETQIDQINMKREEEKYLEIFKKKYNPYSKVVGPAGGSAGSSQGEDENEEAEKDGEPAQEAAGG